MRPEKKMLAQSKTEFYTRHKYVKDAVSARRAFDHSQKATQAKQIAQSVNEAKTQFLALMSHELRTPLTGIISTANMLLAGDQADFNPTELRDFIRVIEQSGEYLLTTIDNMLDLARLEADTFSVVNKPCALQKIIADMMAKYNPLAVEKGLELGVSYPVEALPILFSDPRILQHILVNLVSNAIKYTEKGRITVFVKTLAQTATMIQLKISVADTGIGIAKDKLNSIFEKFSQVETGYTRTSSRLGMGLGLSVTKKLVDLLKGKIFVDSELGEGSTFSIVLDLPIFEECAEKTA